MNTRNYEKTQSEIDSCDLGIAALREKKSRLLERFCKEIFDDYGIRDGDVVYKGAKPYYFSMEDSSAHYVGDGPGKELWVSVHGRAERHHIRTKMVSFAPVKSLEQIMLPKIMRQRPLDENYSTKEV